MLLTVVSSLTVNGVFHPALDVKRGNIILWARRDPIEFSVGTVRSNQT